MIRDPLGEVLEVAMRTPDDAVADDLPAADVAALHLARRRFGVALPPPFAPRPAEPHRLPVRPATIGDGPAIAAVQRRSWRRHYRGLLSDEFLDELDLTYLGGYWSGRTAVPPSPRHRLLVAGPTGEVHGVVDTGPARPPALGSAEGVGSGVGSGGGSGVGSGEDVGEVRTLYLDPTVVGRGLGIALLDAALVALGRSGFRRVVLWVVDGNERADRFYARHGWQRDGATQSVPVGQEVLHEHRLRLPRPL